MNFDYDKAVQEALTEPGKLSAAYNAFHRFSFLNQIMAMHQLGQAEPINTYKGWLSLGRQVQKGEKAIALLMPVKKMKKNEETGYEEEIRFFIERKNWFGLHQTTGEEYVPEPIPNFDMDIALAKLEIVKRPFEMVDGNTQGYAIPNQRIIAINPLAADPVKTQFHESGHVLLHRDHGRMVDGERPDRAVREVEAELTAYLLKASLGITGGLEFSRGYIQNWLGDTSAEKVRFPAVFRAVDSILKAGRPKPLDPDQIG